MLMGEAMFGLVPLPWTFMLTLIVITVLYLITSEIVKRVMFAQLEQHESPAL